MARRNTDRPTPLSAQGRAVLDAVADQPRSVAALVRRLRRPDATLAVTRASLSRTLRRLWRAGFVELHGYKAIGIKLVTRTDVQQHCEARLAALAADPQATYEAHLETCAALNIPPAESPDACLRRFAHRMCWFRVHRVEITVAGRARLTDNCTIQLTDDDATSRLTEATTPQLTDNADADVSLAVNCEPSGARQ